MDEREMFERCYREAFPDAMCSFDIAFQDLYADSYVETAWRFWKVMRRTTPDREVTIEQCAKLVENEYGLHRIADRVRALKTAPTSDKGGA